ncbi:PTS sugar transporter subunit IIA [Pediococcus acidilactici]
MDANVFSKANILFDHDSQTQEEAFHAIAEHVNKLGYADSVDSFFTGLMNREKETTMGFKNGIAIPHSNDASVKRPGLFVIKFDHQIEWNALDKKPVQVAIALSIPQEGSKEHLRLLSKIARKLMDEDFTKIILENDDPDILAQAINEI